MVQNHTTTTFDRFAVDILIKQNMRIAINFLSCRIFTLIIRYGQPFVVFNPETKFKSAF